MPFFDLSTMDDTQLDNLRRDVLTEQERRENLAAIPITIADLSRTYREGGGNPDVLLEAITTD